MDKYIEFPLKRHTLEKYDIFDLFMNLSKHNRDNFTKNNITNTNLQNFGGLIILKKFDYS